MKKIIFNLSGYLIAYLCLTSNVHAISENISSDVSGVCTVTAASANIIPNFSGANRICTLTPSTYKITIYEMGVCTSHPYGAAKTSETFDKASCSVVYSDANPVATDIAGSIGGSSGLPGTSALPPAGTYGYPYLVFKNEFTVSATFTAGNGAVYNSNTGGGNCAFNTNGAMAECTESLDNFNDSTNRCRSGYVGAPVAGGTIDGFIVNDTLVRSNDQAAGVVNATVDDRCVNRTKLVGVMALTNPFTITPSTFGLNFQFVLTNQGVQFINATGGASGVPDAFSSAPFSGKFTVLSQD